MGYQSFKEAIMAMDTFQAEVVATLVLNKTKIKNRVAELKETLDMVDDPVIFNRLTDIINRLMGQVQDIDITVGEIRRK